ncbi:hypothetical protein [Enterococcus canis]|uniref:hypothetical protein n=1 Tax=Enterococcus canis TaxID=214095 RepID=UPI0008366426|nr:hypothetical protein [Enterococcus canis]
MKPNLGYYVQTINNIVKDTEAIGETLHPYYEEIRTAIDNDKVADLSTEHLAEIQEKFESGTKAYHAMLEKVSGLRPPARVMGIHKKFERSYMSYVAGCDEMVLAVTDGVDVTGFNAAEEKQDKATDEISFAISRMTNMLLKK